MSAGPVLVVVQSTRTELYAVNVIVGWVYVVVWLPWCILQLYLAGPALVTADADGSSDDRSLAALSRP